MIDDALFDAEEKMEKAVGVAREDMGSIRTGRANPSMFNKIHIEYYGALTPVTQVASITTPEARLVVIKPYEPSSCLLYTSPSPRDKRQSRMPSSA